MTDKEKVVYDPKAWNPFPQVQPPKQGWYRVQFKHAHCGNYGNGIKDAWYSYGPEAHPNNYWNESKWCHKDHSEVFFKPWDDEVDCQDGKDHIVLTVDEALGIALAMNPTPDDAHIKEWFIERIKEVKQSK